MTLQNVEQPGVSRVQNRTRIRIKCASRQVDARDLRYAQNTQRSVRIGLRSGLKYDLCFGQTANIRCMNRIFRCLTYKQYKREDERDRNGGHVVVVVVPFRGRARRLATSKKHARIEKEKRQQKRASSSLPFLLLIFRLVLCVITLKPFSTKTDATDPIRARAFPRVYITQLFRVLFYE